MKAAAILAVVAACAGRAPAPRATGPSYAALFHAGARWSYEFTHRVPGTTAHEGIARCAVVDVRAFPGGTASRIACTPAIGVTTPVTSDPLAGAWAMDARGLWRLPFGIPASGAPTFDEQDGAELVVAARATERCVVTESPDDGPYARRELCFDAFGMASGDLEFRPGNDADVDHLSFARL